MLVLPIDYFLAILFVIVLVLIHIIFGVVINHREMSPMDQFLLLIELKAPGHPLIPNYPMMWRHFLLSL